MTELTELKRDCEVIVIPSGLRQVLPRGTLVRIMQARGGSYTVSSNIHALYRIDARDADALSLKSPPAMNNAGQQDSFSEQLVWDILKTVYDSEIPVNIVDLGLVYSCLITPHDQGGKNIVIRMTMTAPGCGMSNVLKADVEAKLKRLPDVMETHVEVVFDPPWNPGRMSEAAHLQLGFDLNDDRAQHLIRIS